MIICGLKMFMFGAQLLSMEVISTELHSSLQRFAVFVCLFYVRVVHRHVCCGRCH